MTKTVASPTKKHLIVESNMYGDTDDPMRSLRKLMSGLCHPGLNDDDDDEDSPAAAGINDRNDDDDDCTTLPSVSSMASPTAKKVEEDEGADVPINGSPNKNATLDSAVDDKTAKTSSNTASPDAAVDKPAAVKDTAGKKRSTVARGSEILLLIVMLLAMVAFAVHRFAEFGGVESLRSLTMPKIEIGPFKEHGDGKSGNNKWNKKTKDGKDL